MFNMWTVYVIQCKDKTLYTGITTDLVARLKTHNAGTGAKYTRGRGPVSLLWSKADLEESDARKQEIRIKQMTRVQKISMILNDLRPKEQKNLERTQNQTINPSYPIQNKRS